MASTKSRRGVLLDGPAPPRVRVAPKARANSWEDVADLAATLNFALDEWQEQVLEAAMGERADGRWASKFIGLSAPRQNGKSQLIVARALAGVLLFGEKTIIISAHETDTARQVWQRLIDVVEDNPSLEARVTARMNAVNRESLTFGTGLDKQVIKLKARSASGSRGFSADCLLLDEAQILGKQAWGSIVPTMSARPNPQLWLFGTPPTSSDDPFAFARVREQSEAKKARHCWLEWSADAKDDIDDPETWAKANPSFGVRVSHEACADDRAAMDDDQFRMERLGMWSPEAAVRGVIPLDSWDLAGDETSVPVDRFALGIEVAPDAAWASVSLAGQREDGRWHVELDERRDGSAWVVPYVKRLVEKNPQVRAVVADAGSPTKVLLEEFAAAKVRVMTPRASDVGAAHTKILEGVVTAQVVHTKQPQLRAAVAVATKRTSGDSGLWFFHRASAVADITPIQSATLALLGAQTLKTTRPGPSTEKRRVVVLS
jgi:phage terminase large subunit-like protein